MGGGEGEEGEVCLTCLLSCGLDMERFEGVRSVELGGREEGVTKFEGGGVEVLVPEGGRGGLPDEETAVIVVGKEVWMQLAQ